MGIQVRITALVGLILLSVVALIVGASLYLSKSALGAVSDESAEMLEEAARANLLSQGSYQSLQLQAKFSSIYEYGKGLAREVAFIRGKVERGDMNPQAARASLATALKDALTERPDLLGLFLIFQANRLDGRDVGFVGQNDLGSNDAGRFAMYWQQPTPGKLIPVIGDEALLEDSSPGPSGAPFNAFFKCPLDSKKLCLLEPYFDEPAGDRTLVTSVVFPLLEDGQVIAVMGIDLSLNGLQDGVLESRKALYSGEGNISIISPSGLAAGHSKDSALLGKEVIDLYPGVSEKLMRALKEQHLDVFAWQAEHGVVVPVSPLPGASPWGVVVTVPDSILNAAGSHITAVMDEARVKASFIQLAIGLFVTVLGGALVWVTARQFTRSLLRVATMLEDIADGDGDLTRRLTYVRKDELGRLAVAFNRFLDKLQPIIASVKGAVREARVTADQSAAIARETSQGMKSQLLEVNQVAAALSEMAATANSSSESAAHAASAARNAEEATLEGLQIIEQASMAIAAQARELGVAMRELETFSSSSDRIGAVLEVILSMASQTNLLALNAAIEAARAGDAGRGFAVVADEVRSLAHRTQGSVEEIRSVIESLQSGTRGVVDCMRKSNELAQGNVVQAKATMSALERIEHAVNLISEMNLQIASAAEEQSSVAEEVNRNVATIRDVTESLSDRATQAAHISDRLNELASHQKGLMEHFKV